MDKNCVNMIMFYPSKTEVPNQNDGHDGAFGKAPLR